jgi:hypothetical protein
MYSILITEHTAWLLGGTATITSFKKCSKLIILDLRRFAFKRVIEVEAPTISRKSAREFGEDGSSTLQSPLSPSR